MVGGTPTTFELCVHLILNFNSDDVWCATNHGLETKFYILPLSSKGVGINIANGKISPNLSPPISNNFLFCNTVVSSIGDFEAANSFKIYPNPSEGSVTITSENDLPCSYIIYNMIGSIIAQGFFQNEKQILLQNKGLFILETVQGSRIYRHKIIIQ